VSDTFDPARASLTELTAALHRRVLSAVELMLFTLRALDETHERLFAVVSRRPNDALLADARAAQARIDRGEPRPLEGIPLGVKDLEDAAGLVTTHGSKLFAASAPAVQDSVQVSRLKAAGAIVIGKTNTPEFGHTVLSKNILHGVTCSPWNRAVTPGGSSGGSAAALVAGVLPIVTASDGGGSIRVPASFCGAFGLKPSHGRVPIGPHDSWDAVAMAVHGPLTKTVSDAALLLDQIAGPDPGDAFSLPAAPFRYVDRLTEPLGAKLRVAYSRDFGGVPVQADVSEVVEQAVSTFRELGHRVAALQGGPPDLGTYWGLALARSLDEQMGDAIAAREQDVTRTLIKWIEAARGASPAFWGEQARARMSAVRWFAGVFADHDILLTPTVPCDPPPAKGPVPTTVGDAPLPPAGLAAFTMPANLAWLPAATVRAGLSRAGLPVGLQIIAPRGADDLVLRVARAFERHRPWHPDWPTAC
jgi:Asp-tRNA(Asn)/Glu-tRNA(Gln) amidotransferase A subunit family amidase